jgi:serine phosphatase RsbU (regulator of sigma subunit)
MKRTLSILFSLVAFASFSQTKEQSALYSQLLHSKDSAKKVVLYQDLAHNYYDNGLFERSVHFNKKGLALATELHDTSAMILFNVRLVNGYSNLGAKAQKLEVSFNGLRLSELKKDAINICRFYRILGEAFWREGDDHKSIEYYTKALQIAINRKDTVEIAGIYNNLGLTCRSLQKYDAASEYYFKSIELGQQKKDDNILSKTFNNLAYLRYLKKDILGALEYYKLSLKHAESAKDEFQIGLVYGNIGSMYVALKKYDEAKKYLDRSLEITIKIHDVEGQAENYFNLSKLCDTVKDHKGSLINFKKFHDLTLKLEKENKERDLKREEAKREFENELSDIQKQQELKDVLARTEKEKSQHITLAIAIGFFLVLILLIIIFNRFKVSQAQKVVIEDQKKLVDEKQKEILDSIHYAKRIQSTLLAHTDFVNEHVPNNFIYFQPKDIVSGDFYWATKHNDLFYLAVCDSTGHGVPGAFMSLLNIGFLSEAINEKNIAEPGAVFDHVRQRLIAGISKEGQKDGFDGILLCIDRSNGKFTYVGANNAPLLVRNGLPIELETNKMPVGIGERTEKFKQVEIQIQQDDILYLYTDGFADQFGGEKGKKFKHSELVKLLVSICSLPLQEQKEKLERSFNEWKNTLEQLDDVLVVGIKI